MTFISGGACPLYQFEFTFTELELRQAYRYLGSRGLGQWAAGGKHSAWHLYWISNLALAVALAIQTGNPLWFLIPVPLIYLATHLLSVRRLARFGRRAIASGRYTNPQEPLRLEIGEDWVSYSAVDRRTWISARLITTFRRVNDFYVLVAADTRIFFPVRIIPEKLRADFEVTVGRMGERKQDG